MPKPEFILLAESCSQDITTGLLSVFHLLEGYTFHARPKDSESPLGDYTGPLAKLTFVGIAAWSRSETEDSEQEYEYQNDHLAPGGDDYGSITKGFFSFSKRRQRFIVNFAVANPWKKSGEFRFRSRIRPVGDTNWIAQEATIDVTVDLSEIEDPEDTK